MKFGEQIKERRQELDLTQAEVAEKYFVTRQAVSNWEHDKTYPDLNMLVRISNVYQISLDSLLREDQKLKDYLEQGRAMNSFSVSYGFIWVMFGLSYFLDDSTKGGSIAWYGMVAIFLLAMIYEELVTPFFLGINRRTFYRSGKRPDEKLSIFAKLFYGVFVLAVIVSVILVHQGMSGRYASSVLTILVGVQYLLRKYICGKKVKMINHEKLDLLFPGK